MISRKFCKSKIQNARITQANLKYEGSLTVDENLLKAADIQPGEKVQIVNLDNGNRFETYIIKGDSGSGVIGLNGPAVFQGELGQTVHVISYFYKTEDENLKDPVVVNLDEHNQII
jgi:aspartate 1-decarboxylase